MDKIKFISNCVGKVIKAFSRAEREVSVAGDLQVSQLFQAKQTGSGARLSFC